MSVTTISREQAAEILGVAPNVVFSWGMRGWLEVIVISGETYYTPDSVENLRQRIYTNLDKPSPGASMIEADETHIDDQPTDEHQLV